MIKMTQESKRLLEVQGFTVRFVDNASVCVLRSDNEELFVKTEEKEGFLKKVNNFIEHGAIIVRKNDENSFTVVPGPLTNYTHFVMGNSLWHRLLKEYTELAEKFSEESLKYFKNKSFYRIRFADESKIVTETMPEDVYLIGASHYEDIIESLSKFQEMGKLGFYEHPIKPLVKLVDGKRTTLGVADKKSALYEYFVYSLDTVDDVDAVMFQYTPHFMMKHLIHSYAKDFEEQQMRLRYEKVRRSKSSNGKVVIPNVVNFQNVAVGG